MPKSPKVVFLDRKERVRQFGVDCGDKLTWKGGAWEPGGDYIKKLVVKNVSEETIKLKYKIPETRFFSMDFPELIILSPGMSVTVDVVFRPIRFETYDDHIEFRIKGKSFFVAICARLSKLCVHIPTHLDFGFCPTKEVSNRTFEIRNVGQIDAKFSWKINAPFNLSPMNGSVAPGKTCLISISFHPDNASTFVSKAVCDVVGLPPHVFKASGIGKFPNICASEKVVDFGQQIAGQSGCRVEKEIILRNQSLVPATFKVIRISDDVEPAFSFYPTEGRVLENSFTSFRVTYFPTTSGKFSADDFEIVTPGGNAVPIRCTGTCIGPSVTLRRKERPRKPGKSYVGKHYAVQFGNVKVGEGPSTRVVYLTNKSSLPAAYQFMVEQLGYDFEFVDPPQGILPAGLEKAITIRFCPSAPANYYRRVFCLFRDQMPQFVDLVGTAFDDHVRPQPLLLRHVEAQQKRIAMGISRASPEHILALASKDQDPGAWDDSRVPNYPPESNTFPSASGEAPLGAIRVFEQFFLSYETSQVVNSENTLTSSTSDLSLRGIKLPHITVSTEDVNFGGCSIHQTADYKLVTVTNHAEAKVVCAWRLPVEEEHMDHPPFAVVPEQADIATKKSMQFKVYFQPKDSTKYFNTVACVQAYFKTNRTFRLVNDAAFVPPQVVDVLLRGHSFEAGREQFLPKVDVCIHQPGDDAGDSDSSNVQKKLEFPACHIGEAVYQTIKLTNNGDTPVQFCFLEDPSGVFDVKPKAGYITCNQFQLVALRFAPTKPDASRLVIDDNGTITVQSTNAIGKSSGNSAGRYHKQHTFNLRCILNNANDNAQSIELTGLACSPSIELGDEGTMYVKPTSVGLISERNLEIRNPSRVPMVFQWRIPKRLRDILYVEPVQGMLRGNDRIKVRWKFAPGMVGLNHYHIPITARSIGSESPLEKQTLTIVAEGTRSSIVFEPRRLRFQTVLVGNQVSRDLLLINNSDCDTVFDLRVVCDEDEKPNTETEAADEASKKKSVKRNRQGRDILTFSIKSGTLHARSKVRTVATFWPILRGDYTFKVVCSTRLASLPTNAENTQRQHDKLTDAATSLTLWNPNAIDMGPGLSTESKVPDLAFRERIKETVISCQVVAAAAYPVVAIEDARCSGLSTDRVWDQLSIRRLNDILRTPLTEQEVNFMSTESDHSKQQQISLEQGTSSKKLPEPFETVPFRFTPAVHQSEQENISVQLRNTGNLPVQFYFKFPNDRDIEVEGWADEGEPTAAELRENNIIDAHLFDIQPRRGSLAANEAITVRLSYNYSMLECNGEHDLKVPFRLLNGKQVVLHLIGKTLRQDESLLFVPRPIMDCFPAPLGALAPARQSFCVMNPTPHDILFTVDTGDLQRLCNEHYDFRVIEYVGEMKVTVPAREHVMLPFVFKPLEALLYQCKLSLHYRIAKHRSRNSRIQNGDDSVGTLPSTHGGGKPKKNMEKNDLSSTEALSNQNACGIDNDEPMQELQVQLQGRGFHPFMDHKDILEVYENPMLNPPLKQLLAVPGQIGMFSVERLLFGKVPIGGCVRQISVLRNLTAIDMQFRWDDSNYIVRSGLLKVEPVAGTVPPGGFVTCKFTLQTQHQHLPEIYQCNLDCILESSSLRSKSSKAIRKSVLLARMAMGGSDNNSDSGDEISSKSVRRVTSIRERSKPSKKPINSRLSVVGRHTESMYLRLQEEATHSPNSDDPPPELARELDTPASGTSRNAESLTSARSTVHRRRSNRHSRTPQTNGDQQIMQRDASFLLSSPTQPVGTNRASFSSKASAFDLPRASGGGTTQSSTTSQGKRVRVSVRIEVLLMELDEYRMSEEGYQQSEHWMIADATPALGPLVIAPPAPPARSRNPSSVSLESKTSSSSSQQHRGFSTSGSLVLSNVPDQSSPSPSINGSSASRQPSLTIASRGGNRDLVLREKALTENIISKLFRNVLGDLSVHKTVGSLPIRRVPYYYQFKANQQDLVTKENMRRSSEALASSSPPPLQSHVEPGDSSSNTNSKDSVESSRAVTSSPKEVAKVTVENTTPELQPSETDSSLPSSETLCTLSHVAESCQSWVKHAQSLKSALQRTECQLFTEKVLENAVYNIFQEHLHGEFEVLQHSS